MAPSVYFILAALCFGFVILRCLYLLIKGPEYTTKSNPGCLVFVLCIVFFCLGVRQAWINDEPVRQQQQLEEQQEKQAKSEKAFLKLWHDICYLDVNLDEVWDKLYMPTVTATKDGKMDYVTAYNNFKQLNDFSNLAFDYAEKLEIPDEVSDKLSDEQKKKLKNAIQSYQNSVAARCNASEKLMKIVDNDYAKPSDISKINEEVTDGQNGSFLIRAAMQQAAEDLNIELTDPEEEAKNAEYDSNSNE